MSKERHPQQLQCVSKSHSLEKFEFQINFKRWFVYLYENMNNESISVLVLFEVIFNFTVVEHLVNTNGAMHYDFILL